MGGGMLLRWAFRRTGTMRDDEFAKAAEGSSGMYPTSPSTLAQVSPRPEGLFPGLASVAADWPHTPTGADSRPGPCLVGSSGAVPQLDAGAIGGAVLCDVEAAP